MRVLMVTLVKRAPPDSPDWYGAPLYQRAHESMQALEWAWQLDHIFMVGGDRCLIGAHPRSSAYLNIARKYERARELAVLAGYDAIFQVESDMIIPPDALRKLCEVNGDIVYGLYVWRHGDPTWSCYTKLTDKHGESIIRDRGYEQAKAAFGNVIESKGVGDGCTLIRRCAFTEFTRHAPRNGFYSCDWSMSLDAQRLGLKQMHHLDVICGHIDPNGGQPRILWPDRTTKELYRIEDLEVANGSNRPD